MATAVGRLLSFTKNAKVFVSPLRLSIVPVHRYSVEVSSTGEAITHTGQVNYKVISCECLVDVPRRPNITSIIASGVNVSIFVHLSIRPNVSS